MFRPAIRDKRPNRTVEPTELNQGYYSYPPCYNIENLLRINHKNQQLGTYQKNFHKNHLDMEKTKNVTRQTPFVYYTE